MRIESAAHLLASTGEGRSLYLKDGEIHTQSKLSEVWKRFLNLFHGRASVLRKEAELARAMGELLRLDSSFGPHRLTIRLPAASADMLSPRELLQQARRDLFKECIRSAIFAPQRSETEGRVDAALLPEDQQVLLQTLPDLLAVPEIMGAMPLADMPRQAQTILSSLLRETGGGDLYNLYTNYRQPPQVLAAATEYMTQHISLALKDALMTEHFDRQGLHIPNLQYAAHRAPCFEGAPCMEKVREHYDITAPTEEQRTELGLVLALRSFGQSVPERKALSWLLGPEIEALACRLLTGVRLPPDVPIMNPFAPRDILPPPARLTLLNSGSGTPLCNIRHGEGGDLCLDYTFSISAEGQIGSLGIKKGWRQKSEKLVLEATSTPGESPVNLSGRMGTLSFTLTLPGDQFDGSLQWARSQMAPDGYEGPVVLVDKLFFVMDQMPPLRLRTVPSEQEPLLKPRQSLVLGLDDQDEKKGEESVSLGDKIENFIFAPIFW